VRYRENIFVSIFLFLGLIIESSIRRGLCHVYTDDTSDASNDACDAT